MNVIKRWDPLAIGITDIMAAKLIMRLLTWNPEHRITAARALQHAYFHQPYNVFVVVWLLAYICINMQCRCEICGSEWEFEEELHAHEHAHHHSSLSL